MKTTRKIDLKRFFYKRVQMVNLFKIGAAMCLIFKMAGVVAADINPNLTFGKKVDKIEIIQPVTISGAATSPPSRISDSVGTSNEAISAIRVCQKAITQSIIDAQADYVLNLKSNHRHLHGQVAAWFQKNDEADFSQQAYSFIQENTQTNNHGRIERREHWLMEVPEHLKRATKNWTKLQTIAMVRRTRQVAQEISEETHYYISSLPLSAGAKNIAKAIRSHWAVENCLHWSLDVAFREDASQVRKDEGPANLACLRRLALTQLKRETSLKVGIKNKRNRAGWDTAYMAKVLEIEVLSI